MRSNYRIMQWHSAMDGPWSPEAAQRFRDDGFDGLVVVPHQDWAPKNLEFLRELRDLRYFSYTGRLQDDSAVFSLEALEDLTLVTGSRRAVPDVVQPALGRIVITDRPGMHVAQRWPALKVFRIGTWRGTDFRMVRNAESLTHVHVEGRRQQGTLEGIQGCPNIEALVVINFSANGISPLRALSRLTELRLLAARPTPAHGLVRLSYLESPHLEKLWISNASELRDVGALRNLPALRELRLLDCKLSGADREALARLPRRVAVQLVDR